MIDMETVEIDRGNFLNSEDLDELEERYKRHEFTESGVSPWAPPGHENAVYSTTGNEHNEYGEISEDKEMRRKMVDKRQRKLESAKEDAIRPGLCGPENAEYTLISWGSSFGAVKEATEVLTEEGADVRHCHLGQAWPLPEQGVESIFENSENTVVVESNKTSQMGRLIRRETGLKIDHSILKYDGRPLTPGFVVEEFRKIKGGN
jgi:2-oxoglutarate ferredoxin oxidoreductase subunit alpha